MHLAKLTHYIKMDRFLYRGLFLLLTLVANFIYKLFMKGTTAHCTQCVQSWAVE